MRKIPWGGVAFIAIPSALLGLAFDVPLWLFAAYIAAWTALCAVVAWVMGEFRKE